MYSNLTGCPCNILQFNRLNNAPSPSNPLSFALSLSLSLSSLDVFLSLSFLPVGLGTPAGAGRGFSAPSSTSSRRPRRPTCEELRPTCGHVFHKLWCVSNAIFSFFCLVNAGILCNCLGQGNWNGKCTSSLGTCFFQAQLAKML